MIKILNLNPGGNILSGNYDEGSTVLVKCDAEDAAFTVTMPSAKNLVNVIFSLIKTDSSANAVTIDFAEDETANGADSQSLSSQYSSITLIGDLVNYYVVAST